MIIPVRLPVTANAGVRAENIIKLKEIADEVLQGCRSVESVIVVKTNDVSCPFKNERDLLWYQEEMAKASAECQ